MDSRDMTDEGGVGTPRVLPEVLCIGVYECGGRLAWRFALAPDVSRDLTVALVPLTGETEDEQGGSPRVQEEISVEPIAVGNLGDGECRGYDVVSAILPDLRGTVELRDGEGAVRCSLGPEEARSLTFERDIRMINPQIDPIYPEWRRRHPVGPPDPMPQEGPLFSIVVPLFRTPLGFLHDMVDSVRAQSYGRWELVLVNASPEDEDLTAAIHDLDDERIRVVTMERNLGIAGNTNAGIAQATGDYVCFLDHDDVIDPHLLAWYAHEVSLDREVDLLYCDEDNFEDLERGFFSPRLKPAFNLDMMTSRNSLIHCLGVSRWVLEHSERSSSDLDGAQDYDLIFKAVEVARSVRHVPLVLYHWREHEGSTNGGSVGGKPYAIAAARRAIEEFWARRGIAVRVTKTDIPYVYDTEFLVDEDEMCSVVVLGSDPEKVRGCIDSIGEGDRTYLSEIIVVATQGPWDQRIEGHGIPVTVIDGRGLTGFSAWARVGSRSALGDQAALVSQEVRFVSDGVISRLLGYFHREEVGLVAPRTLRPDGLVGNVGLYVADGRLIPLDHDIEPGGGGGYEGYGELPCDFSVLAPQMVMVDRRRVAEVGGWGECRDPWAAMADLCLRAREAGLLCVSASWADVMAPGPVFTVRSFPAVGDAEEVARILEGAQGLPEVLANPSVSCAEGYPHLLIDWNVWEPEGEGESEDPGDRDGACGAEGDDGPSGRGRRPGLLSRLLTRLLGR